MHTTDTCLDQPQPFANSFALLSFGAGRDEDGTARAAGEDFGQQYAQYVRESAQLMRQISDKAPQLASVLDQLNEGCATARVEFDEPPQGALRRRVLGNGATLDTAAGFLSHAFPGAAPLFHGCLAFLQLKMIKNKKQA
ncbi:MAG: hypothetical protein GAK35_00102 [Herbaspirillum frisingense]|uniref:Uncharacterized protein n=1 Tax=Herbaspirillum frisingense TaxID=92645 RepID=A0A7V8G0G9_9BURK|nr:MAG: hypothetical protein GAK35_00102 [Herbaspirillum frisingense]